MHSWKPFCTLLIQIVCLLCLSTPLAFGAVDDDDDNAPPWAVIHTNQGSMVMELYEKKVPKTVAHFIGLATGDTTWTHPKTKQKRTTPFYNGLKVHKIVPTYWVQMGCPLGNGKGGPGFTIRDEFHPTLRHRGVGIVSMAGAGSHRNGSQFFITLRTASWLDPKVHVGRYCSNFKTPVKCTRNRDCQRYKKMFPKTSHGAVQCVTRKTKRGSTIFGKIVHGLPVLNQIGEQPVDVNGRPIQTIRIVRITIHRARKWKRSWLRASKTNARKRR